MSGYFASILQGALLTVGVSLAALMVAILLGLLGAVAKLSGRPLLVGLATVYTTLVRGVPELVLMLLIFYGGTIGLNHLLETLGSKSSVDINPFLAGVLTIGFIYGAYMTETFRGAFLGVDRGQVEAARALGLKRGQIFRHVRVPQMWRLALPNFGNHMLSIMKDTALISIIGLEEIVFVADMANAVIHRPFTLYMTVALIYLAITTVITLVVARLEVRANRHLRGAR